MFTQRKKNIVKEYDAVTQTTYEIGVPNLESLFPILKIEQYLLEINKQIFMYVWSGWMGVFLPEEEYQKESVPP